ncbi:MAG TPA: hypothetical protein VG328_07975, partial [Stellaceae bacterium]|nr:hypothetical protein [Stellaceae bacterium]
PSATGNFAISHLPVGANGSGASVTYAVSGDDKAGVDMTFGWSWPTGGNSWSGVSGGSAIEGCDTGSAIDGDQLTFGYTQKAAAPA